VALGTLAVNVVLNNEAFEREMRKTRQSIGYLHKDVSGIQRAFSAFGRFVGVTVGFHAINQAIRASITEFSAFEKKMAEVSTMLDDQAIKFMPQYDKAIRRMAMNFGETTDSLGTGLREILSALIAPSDALGVLEASTKAARAGLADTATAVDVITTVMNAYNVEAARATDISDKLFVTIIRGKTTFPQLAPEIGKVAAIAATAGESFDDLLAVFSAMTRAGLQTDIAITSLRAILLDFLKPQEDSIEAARKYGVEMNAATLRAEGLTGVIQKLKKATAEELVTIVPTSRGIAGFAAAIQKAGELTEDYESMVNSAGETEKAYQKISDTTAFNLGRLSQEWGELKKILGEVISLPLSDWLSSSHSTIVRYLEDFREGIQIATQLQAMVRQFSKPPWLLAYESIRGGKSSGPRITDEAAWQRFLNFQKTALEAAKTGGAILAPPGIASGRQIDQKALDRMATLEEQLREEIALTGHLNEARQHAKMFIEFETEANKAYTKGSVEATDAIERFRMKLEDLEQAQRLSRIAEDIGNSFTSAFDRAIIEGEKLRVVLAGIAQDIARSVVHETVSVPIGQAIAGAIGGLGGALGGAGAGMAPSPEGGTMGVGYHQGGIVGETALMRNISGLAMLGAPRLHTGLRPNEFAAVLERGETVVPKGDGRGNLTINVSTPDATATQRWLWANRHGFADMMTGAGRENNKVRRMER
jgi:TP901 family phage tail tape measure protein